MIKAILIIYFVFISNLWAESVKYVLYRPFQGQEKLKPALSETIKKVSLRFLASLPGHQLILNSAAPPEMSQVSTFAVEGKIEAVGSKFNLTLELLDIKNKKIINRIFLNEIREEDLVRLINGGLEALFDPAIKVKAHSKKLMQYEYTITNVNDEKTIDFKDRIRAMQMAADSGLISKVKDDDKKDDEDLAQIKKNNKNENQNTSNNMKLNSFENLGEIAKFNVFKVPRSHRLSASFQKRFIDTRSFVNTTFDTKYLVRTKSDINIFNAELAGHVWTFKNQKWAINYLFNFAKPMKVNVPAPSLISLGTSVQLNQPSYSLGLGIRSEDFLFFNVSESGSGLSAGLAQIYWAEVFADYSLHLFGKNWKFRTYVSKSLKTQSNWKGLDTYSATGTNMGLDWMIPYKLYGWDLALQLHSTSFNAEGPSPLNIKDTRVALNTNRTF